MSELEGKERDLLGGEMSFLEHLDEFRKRLVRCLLVIAIAFVFCWIFRVEIYQFLEVPVRDALSSAQRQDVALEGIKGKKKLLSFESVEEGEVGLYVFDQDKRIGNVPISAGTSVLAKVAKSKDGTPGLFTEQPIFVTGAVIPKGIRLPVKLKFDRESSDPNARLIITTAIEPFTLYVTVSLYAAIAISIPFILLQIWGFVSPALYKHERKYVTPFIFLSTVSFVLGASFAYYILFPPAVTYLLGLGSEFQPLLRATDYFDFITLIMLAMGIIFQMPAISYVLSRIGIIDAALLIRSWKIALVVILLVAAFVSPTGDVLNLLLFATPMTVLYGFSIIIARVFGKEREKEA